MGGKGRGGGAREVRLEGSAVEARTSGGDVPSVAAIARGCEHVIGHQRPQDSDGGLEHADAPVDVEVAATPTLGGGGGQSGKAEVQAV